MLNEKQALNKLVSASSPSLGDAPLYELATYELVGSMMTFTNFKSISIVSQNSSNYTIEGSVGGPITIPGSLVFNLSEGGLIETITITPDMADTLSVTILTPKA